MIQPTPRFSRTSRRMALASGALACSVLVAACGSSSSPSANGKTSASNGSAGSSATTAASASGSGSSTASGAVPGLSKVNVSGVTLNVGDQAGTGIQTLLTAAGLVNKLPFKVKWDDFTSGPDIVQALQGGSVDVGGVGNAPVVFGAASGDKIEVVGAVKADPASGALMVPKNSPIHSVSQLKGKSVAVNQGSSDNYHILEILDKAGWTVKDINLEYLAPPEALAAFASSKLDAWDIWSPYIEEIEAKYGARVITDWAPYGPAYSFEVASQSALANPQKKAAIQDLLAYLNAAYKWSATHQSRWASVWGKATGYSTTVMAKAAKDDTEIPTPVTPAVVASENGLVAAFYKAGLIPKKVNIADFTNTEFNSALYGSNS